MKINIIRMDYAKIRISVRRPVRFLTSFVRTMLAATLLSILCFFQSVQGGTGDKAQVITLSESNTTIREVLKTLEKQTHYRFFYYHNQVDTKGKVSVSLQGAPLETVLKSVLSPAGIGWKISGRQIFLFPSKNRPLLPSSTLSPVEIRALESFLFRVSGQVTDAKGDPIPGVNVIVKGSPATGTISDAAGKYALELADPNSVLVFSFIGFTTQEVPVGNRSVVDVVLAENRQLLDEVVVVGYGTQKRSNVTGAVQQVKLENSPLMEVPNANPLLALSGTIAGVNINPQSLAGQDPLGSMSIRGENAIDKDGTGLNKPLLIVDGMIFNGSINEINIQDVSTIDVLKDASAAAIYGSRSANGVIIITTKKGHSEKPLITLNASYAFQNWSRKQEMQDNADIYLKNRWDFYVGRGDIPADAEFNPSQILNTTELSAYQQGIFTNWLDEITQYAPIQNYNINVSGSSKVFNYYLSAGIFNQKGVILNDQYKKKTFMGKVEARLNDYLTIGGKVNYFDADNSGLKPKMQEATWMSPFSFTTNQTPGYENWLPSHPGGASGSPLTGSALRPGPSYATNELTDRTIDGIGWLDVKAPWIEGLAYRFSVNGTGNTGINNQMFDPRFWVDTRVPAQMDNYNSLYLRNVSGYAQTGQKNTWLINHLLTYANSFGDHTVDAMLGYTRDSYRYELLKGTGTGFDMPVTLLWDGLHLAKSQQVSKTQERYQNVGRMARLSYSYLDRYFFTGNWRRDGFSGFSPGNKYGDFIGASLGWAISGEKFMRNPDWLSYLKLRASYGETGNQGISPYATLSRIATSYNVYGETSALNIYPTSMSNSALTWATTATQNIGVDFALFGNRISGTLDLYKSRTTNQLLTRSLPILTGYPSVLTNAGRVDNKGIELTLTGLPLKGNGAGSLRWEPGIIFALNRNKLVELYGTFDEAGNPVNDIGSAPSGNAYLVGKSINSIWDMKMLGIVQENDTEYLEKYNAKPGDVKYLDYNEDGVINANDRHYQGDRDPLFTANLNNTLSYRNFGLYFSFKWTAGNDRHFLGRNPYGTMVSTSVGSNAQLKDVTPYTVENPNNEYPRVNWVNSFSYQFWHNREFFKLKDISLSYTFEKELLSRIGIQSAKLFVSANNLLTFSKWTGLDPEDGGFIAAQPGSNYNWSYPVLRTFSFGTTISF